MEGNNPAISDVPSPASSANLSVSPSDAEAQVINKERWEQMSQMAAAGQSISAIARALDLDRKTVRRWLREQQWAPYRRQPAVTTLLAPHQAWLKERAPQVHYSARILFQELRQHGYQGSYDTVKVAVRPLRAEATLADLTQCRYETAPGQQAQIDWGEARLRFGDSGERVRVNFFVMTLGFSRRAYVEAFSNERMATLFAAHEHAFAHFNGHCAVLLYDRMRTVLDDTTEGSRKWNSTFKAFADYWGFEPRVCRPYRPQTKGKVESGVKYVKRNFLPGRQFRDLQDLNEQLQRWTLEVADLRIHGTTHQRPIEHFAEEAKALVPTAGQPAFLDAVVRERVVAEDWLVAIDSNRYSVPCRLIGKRVQVLRIGGHWHISHGGELVAQHPVLAGRYQLSVQAEHGPGAAARNARQRYSSPRPAVPVPTTGAVQVRDLAIYEQLLEA
jgi:transposase